MTARDPYFDALQRALKRADVCQPTLIVDLDRLDANLDVLLADLPPGMAYRIVVKSLPCPDLVAHVRTRTGTERLMTFNLPMLLDFAARFPAADQLLGKPLPVAALRRFIDTAAPGAIARVQWLVDTPARLADYAAVADDRGADLRIALELDVGLHRGGFEPGAALRDALVRLRDGARLTFTAFMGYEPHVAALPRFLGWQRRALAAAWVTYREAISIAADVFDAAVMATITRNAGGSPTYRLYQDTTVANELSVGSALVKPTHFDTPLLRAYQPAAFIAAPVLKAVGPTRIPGLESLDALRRAISPATARAFFIHGGRWMADPVDPPRLSYNRAYGRSSNQEMLNGPAATPLAPDDFVFLRPHQSEAVFLHFGDIAVVRDGAIIDWWPPLAVST